MSIGRVYTLPSNCPKARNERAVLQRYGMRRLLIGVFDDRIGEVHMQCRYFRWFGIASKSNDSHQLFVAAVQGSSVLNVTLAW